MKILGSIRFAGTLAASSLALGSVGAAEVQGDEAVRRWLTEMSSAAATQAPLSTNAQRSGRIGNLEIVSIKDLAAPPEVRAALLRTIESRAAGPQIVPAGDLPSVAGYIGKASRSVLSDSAVRDRLLVPPSEIINTPLKEATLLSSSWAGSSIGGKSTGFSRIFSVEGIGLVEFNEDNYQLGSGSITQIVEALNDSVAGMPATSFMQRSEDGRSMASLIWRNHLKSYELRLFSDENDHVEKNLEFLKNIAAGVE